MGRIGAVPLELSERKLGRLEVGATGRDLTLRAVLVDVCVPDQAAPDAEATIKKKPDTKKHPPHANPNTTKSQPPIDLTKSRF